MLCVDCGAEVPKTIHGSCPACYTSKTPLMSVPDVIDVELCAHCDARHVGAHWVDPMQGAPLSWVREEAVRDAVGVHRRVQDAFLQFDEAAEDDKHFRFQVGLDGAVEGVEVHGTASVLVRQKRGVCDRCSRMQGNFYAAIIQLRATDRDVRDTELRRAHRIVAEELGRLQNAGNRFAFLTKEGAVHGGWDYYIGDIEAGRQAARLLKQRLSATVQETAKLVGRREGEDVHRVTFLVRIRLFSSGDFALAPGKRVVRVQTLSHGRAAAVDLLDHRKTRIPETDLKRLYGPEDVVQAVLVSQDPNDLQVLDPVTLVTQDVPRPQGYQAEGETVAVLRHEERLYLVPTGGANKS